LVRSPHCLPLNPSTPHIKQLQDVSLFYFTYIYEVHQPYSLTFISFVHPPASHKYPPPVLYLFYSPVFCY
jgi:hypothetical protein